MTSTFITKIKSMQQCIKDIEQSTNQTATFNVVAKKLGARVKKLYRNSGSHDGLLIERTRTDAGRAIIA